MKKTLALLVACLPSMTLADSEVPLYIGTYTSDGASRGIYRALLNTETGQLSEPVLAAEASGPSFLALHPNGKFLYAVHEPTDGDVSAYKILPDGTLERLNSESSGGGGPCHVTVDPAGKNVFTASYGAGSLASLPIKADGSLAPPATVFENSGSGPNKARQEAPHLHAIYADEQNRHVYACDLGTDEILVFTLDAATGILTPAEPKSVTVPPGGGPRHLALHPSGKFAFVNNEMGNSVTAFKRNPENGSLELIHTVSTLPEGETTEGRSTAEIHCHPNGKWLYVSNRGHDSIAVFEIDSDGKLTRLQVASAQVSIPRGFGIDPSGRWLVAAGQRSNDLTALSIDQTTGKLQPGPNKVRVGMPVCVIFQAISSSETK